MSSKATILVLIEDCELDTAFFKRMLSDSFPDVELIACSTWMEASEHISNASIVVIDWVLHDRINALESGAISLLEKMGIPFVIFTGAAEFIPPEVTCKIIDKTDVEGLISFLTEAFSNG